MHRDLKGTEVADRQTVEELVESYASSEASIMSSFAEVARALKAIDTGPNFRNVNFEEPKTLIESLRRGAWQEIVARAEVRKVMSVKAWQELNQKLDREEPLPINVANVSGFIEQLKMDVPEMLTEAVHEAFDFLRPHWNRFKTNSQFEIGRKVILDYALESGYGGSHWRITTHWDQKFIALENVFAMLDRKLKTQAPKTHYSALSNAVRESGPDCHGATDLFEFKGYKRGTLHLTFRRPDLVARLNATAGGNRLKPK